MDDAHVLLYDLVLEKWEGRRKNHLSCIISRSPVVVVVRANINHRAKKKFGGKGSLFKRRKGEGGGGLVLEPVPPLLACIVMLARIKKSTHTRRLLPSLFLTWHIWPPAKAHLAIKSERSEYHTIREFTQE